MNRTKRAISLILILLLLASLPILTAGAAGTIAAGTAKVNASALNVRTGAGTNYSVIRSIPNGTTVVVLEKTSDSWYRINSGGTAGYVSADYLKDFSVKGDLSMTGSVNESGVRWRDSASTSGGVLGTIPSGTKVSVTGIDNGWYRLNYDGKTGYMRSDYIDLVGSGTAQSGSTKSETTTSTSTKTTSSSSASSSDRTGKVNADYVNFRTGPSTSSSVIRMLNKGTEVTVLEESSGWYKLNCNGTTGYMSSKYVTVSEPKKVEASLGSSSGSTSTTTTQEPEVTAMDETGKVTGNYVNFRSGPSTNYKVIATLAKGTKVEILGKTGGWYKIKHSGSTGYMSADYVKVVDANEPAESTPAVSTNLSKGEEIAAYTKQFAGCRYVYGGASPSGFDCSGLVYYVYGKFGYSIPHGATSQYNALSKYVEKSDLQPGDLVFFSNNGFASITHVGMYLGNNKFIHASGTNVGVIISDLSSDYYTSVYYGAKRVV